MLVLGKGTLNMGLCNVFTTTYGVLIVIMQSTFVFLCFKTTFVSDSADQAAFFACLVSTPM